MPEWVVRLIEHAEEPESGTEDEVAYAGWLFWDQPIAGLPPSDSPEGWAIKSRAWERARELREVARQPGRRR